MDLLISEVIEIAKELSEQTNSGVGHFIHWTDLLQTAAIIHQTKFISRAAERLEGI